MALRDGSGRRHPLAGHGGLYQSVVALGMASDACSAMESFEKQGGDGCGVLVLCGDCRRSDIPMKARQHKQRKRGVIEAPLFYALK